MRANTIQNDRLAPVGATQLVLPEDFDELTGTTMQPQDMKIWASSDGVKLDGITLIGCPRGSGKQFVVQGVLYCVMKITEEEIELQMLPDYCHGSKDEKLTIPIEEVCLQLRLSHAMCYYTIQGRTIRDRHIVLLDTDHRHFNVRALIVGLSRAPLGKYLHIGNSTSEGLFCGPRKHVQIMRSV